MFSSSSNNNEKKIAKYIKAYKEEIKNCENKLDEMPRGFIIYVIIEEIIEITTYFPTLTLGKVIKCKSLSFL